MTDVCGIPVEVEFSSGVFFVTSQALKGLLVAKDNEADALRATPEVIASLLVVGGMPRSLLEGLNDRDLLRMHDDIHRIMSARAVDMKARAALAQEGGGE